MHIMSYQNPATELTCEALSARMADIKTQLKANRESILALFDAATGLYIPKTPGLVIKHIRTKADDDRLLTTIHNLVTQTRLLYVELSTCRRITHHTRNAWLIQEVPYKKESDPITLPIVTHTPHKTIAITLV